MSEKKNTSYPKEKINILFLENISDAATAQFANTLFLLRTGRGEGEQTAFELLLCFLGLRLTIGEAIGGSCTVSSPKTRFMNAGNFARRHSLKHSGRN